MKSLHDFLYNDYNKRWHLIGPYKDLLRLNNVHSLALQHGGTESIYEININKNNYFFRTNYFKDPISNKVAHYSFVSVDGKGSECATLLIDGKTGIIQGFNKNTNCICSDNNNKIEPVTKNIGTILIQIIIEYCKYRNLHKILASDNAHYHSIPGYSIELKYSYTLTNGKPWYYKFGFKFTNAEYHKNVEDNYERYMVLRFIDIPTEYIKDKYVKTSDNEKIGKYFKWLEQNDTKYFKENYESIFRKLGFKPFSGQLNEMELILYNEIIKNKQIHA